MAFDISAVLDSMAGAAGDVLSAEWPKVQDCVKAAFAEEREALEAIATARLLGEIDEREMKAQLEDEKETLRITLLACRVKEKIAVQKATNAAFKVFSDAVKAALAVL